MNKAKKLFLLILIGCEVLILSGCAGTNRTLEKEHILNNGCFITCMNNAKALKKTIKPTKSSTFKNIQIKNLLG